MQKISDSTNTANGNGEYTEGNPATGVPATLIKAPWLNAVQRELINLIVDAGISLKPDDDGQVLKAVKILADKVTDLRIHMLGFGVSTRLRGCLVAGSRCITLEI